MGTARIWFSLAVMLVAVSPGYGAIANEKHVYSGQSIQAAINTAVNGDVIIVHEGVYIENIDFSGKAITVRSTEPDNPVVTDATVIDGSYAGNVVTFANGERNNSVLDGITIQNGMSGESGGGIFCSSSSPVITNCTIKENYAKDGAGIFCEKSFPIIINCTIWGSRADRSGGGFYSDPSSSPIVANCTFSNNEAARYELGSGGGMCITGPSAMVINCIVWGNRPNEVDAMGHLVTYSDIGQSDYPGTGDICIDPMFIDPENNNYRLMPTSPCVNKGDSRTIQMVTVPKAGPCLMATKNNDEKHHAYEDKEVNGYFYFVRSGPTNNPVTIYYNIGGTATNGVDYFKLPGRATIPAGSSYVCVYIDPYDDNDDEGTETVILTPKYTEAGDIVGSINLNIYDNDSKITVTASDAGASEPGKDTGKFTVKRNVDSGKVYEPLTVKYDVGGTAKNGTDYNKLSGSVTIEAGKSSADIIVTPRNDSNKEGSEEVIVKLLSSTSYKVGSPANATVGIADDDISTISVYTYDGVVKEGTKTVARFWFERTGGNTNVLDVGFYLSGTASYAADYTTNPPPYPLLPSWLTGSRFGSVTIPAGASSVAATVTVLDDNTKKEGNETITCVLSTCSLYKILDKYGSSTITIKDND